MTLADRVVVMNHGIIEQVGTPAQVYHTPTSRFVAGFIGSPAMNFLPCRIDEAGGGGLSVRVNSAIQIKIPAERAARYMSYKGKEMVFGIRPEHLTQRKEDGRSGFEPIDLLVDVVEPMGMETMVHFFVDGAPICARLDPATNAEPEKMLGLTADMNQMHLMEKDTGKVVY
jgi:multiple sugar transport system ATP-binding protein